MKLDSLYAIQKKADLQREDKYREIIRQKYAKTKILRVSDSDKYWRAFNGLGDTETVKLVLDTLRFFSDATIRIMDDCKCFTEPLSYDMQARYFLSSKKLPSDKIATVPIGDNTVLIMFAFSRSEFSPQYCCYIQPYTLLSEETRKVTTSTKARDWFIYAVNCLAFTNMATTTFVNIDNDEKLEAARKRVDSGNFELPLQELAFLNYKVYPWEKAHMFFPIFDRVRKTTKGYNRDLTCGCNKMPEIVLPAVDLNTLEDKLYNFFVYQMRTQKLVGADTETTGLNVFFAKIVSLGLTFNLKMGYYLSFRHTRPKRQMLSMQSLSFIRFFAKNGCNGTFEVNNAYKYYDYIDKENDKNLSIDTAKAICNHMKNMQSIWHNARYDYSMVYEDFGIDLPIFMDTMLAHYVARPGYNANREKSGLKIIAPEELEVESWKIDVTKVQDDFKDIEGAYNARDCCYMYGIALALGDELLKPSVWDLFEIEMKYLPVLICAELSGVRLDAVKLKEIEADLVTKRDRVIRHITDLFCKAVDEHFNQLVDEPTVFGKPFLKDKIYLQYKSDPSKENKKALLDTMKQRFNINSNQLMKFFFFKMMGVIPPRKCPVCGSRNFENRDFCNNPSCKNYNVEKSVPYEFVSKVTGEPSFDKHVKEKLSEAGNYLMKELDEYAAANKLITSYCNMDALINPLTGNIHPSYNQARTATGRLSSSRPNFQQLPKKAGKYIRTCIVANDDEHCLISADYAGQEIRILAAHTRDEKLLRAYNPCYHCKHNNNGAGENSIMGKCPSESHEEGSECNTVDIHSFITKQVYHDKINVPVEKIKEVPEFNRMRSICKSVTFGLAYGGTAVGLANSTGIPLEEAKEVVELYFNTFPAIKEYIEKAQKYVDEHGEIIDMVGRKRKFHYAGWGDENKANAYYLHDERTHELKDRYTIDLNWEGEKYWKKTGFKKGNDEFRSKIGKDLRAGINFPIQGLAASMTKIAATELYNEFKKHPEWDAKIIQFIHDEVLVHCKKTPDIVRKVIAAITDCMVNRINMPSHCLKNQPLGWSWPSFLPMSVEAEVGDSYGAIMDPEKYIASFEEEYKAAHPEPEKVDIEELITEDEDETDWTADETGDWKNMAMLTGKVEDVPEGTSVQKEEDGEETEDIQLSDGAE